MNQNYFETQYSGFDQPPQYSINHQEDLNQQDVHDRWEELLNMMRSFCEKFLQQKQATSINQSPLQEMSIQDMEDLKQHYLDEMLSLSKFNGMSIEINKKKELQRLEQVANLSTYPSQRFKSFCYDDYDYEERSIPLRDIISKLPPSIAITPVLLTLEPEDSLIMGNEELITIPEKDSDEVIKSSVEDFVPIPSESEDTSRSDSYDDESLSDEDVPEDNFKIYSNPLFEFNDEYISSNVNPLFDEVLEDIECKESYDSNLDELTLLVTPLSDSNEDEFFDPGDDIKLLLHHDSSTPKISVVSILEGFTDEPPLDENDDLFDLKSKTNEWKKILYDAPIDDLMTKDKIFDLGGDIDEIDAFLDVDISTDIKDGYHDSKGDILYLESLLSNDTILSLPPEVFLDHDPRSLSDINDLKIMVKVFDPGIHEKNISLTYVSLTFEDHHYLSFTYVIRIFLPYFTYSVVSPFLLSSGSEDIIFDPGISAFHFSSLKPVTYECPLEVCSSTCFVPNITMIWGEIARIMKTLVLVVLSIFMASDEEFSLPSQTKNTSQDPAV
ncbi:hypothetical protein Tco_0853529 [Tanacetum coccineum]